jgi:hypothetical protein
VVAATLVLSEPSNAAAAYIAFIRVFIAYPQGMRLTADAIVVAGAATSSAPPLIS